MASLIKYLLVMILPLICSLPTFAKEESQEIRLGLENFPMVFNPILKSGTLHFSVSGQLFAGLTRLNERGEPIPYLAKDWTISEDGLDYIFTIRENAKFHDNTNITIEDIIFSIEMSKQYHPFYPFLEQIESAIQITDKKGQAKLQIHLKRPLKRLPHLLISLFVPIMPKHVYGVECQSFKELASHREVIGSGPFQLHSYNEKEFIKLTKYPHFFLENAQKVDSLYYAIFLDSQEMLYALGKQDIDIAPAYSHQQVEEFFQQFSTQNFTQYPLNNVYPYFSVLYNYKKQIFQSQQVRQALSLALNRDEFVKYIFDSSAQAMDSPIPKESVLHINIPQEYNIEKANRLLDEAGYKRKIDGKRFSLTLSYFEYSPLHISITHWLQKELSSQLGIEVHTNRIQNKQEEQALHSGDFDMVLAELFTWNDPTIALERLYSSKNIQKGVLWTNLGEYSNYDVDTLFAIAKQKEFQKEMQKTYDALQKLLVSDSAALWLFSNEYFTIVNTNIKNFETLPYGMMSPFLNIEKNAIPLD